MVSFVLLIFKPIVARKTSIKCIVNSQCAIAVQSITFGGPGMQLQIIINDKTSTIEIPEALLDEAEDFFQKIDRDMDRGWQMGPEYIENLTNINRCQIAADRILQAVDTRNQNLLLLMAGYILKRLPGTTGVNIDTSGEMLNTKIVS